MFCKKLCTRHDAWAGTLSCWSCQSPVAQSCGLLNHLNSFCRGMFMLNTKLVQISCSIRSVILNVTATQYTCSLNGIYHPHWLVQWSHHCSCMHIPVHSPWLPIYIDVTQTTLIILTMAGLFPDRQCIPWNGIAGVYGCFIFKFLRNLHIFFLSYFTNFHSTSSAQ